jgi:hypothetical protein
VAIAQSTSKAMTSYDGINWTLQTTAEAATWNAVCYGAGQFVAVGSSGSNRVMTSPDGITWTSQVASGPTFSWKSVCYGNGLFVAVSTTATSTATHIMTSPDGVTWTARTAPANLGWQSVAYGNGFFVAVAQNGIASGGQGGAMTSPDGITWTQRPLNNSNFWAAVTYGNGVFLATGDRYPQSDYHAATSYDNGVTWNYAPLSTTPIGQSLCYGNGVFVAASGLLGTIYSSGTPSGEQPAPNNAQRLNGVALSGLGSGLLKLTSGTPSIASKGADFAAWGTSATPATTSAMTLTQSGAISVWTITPTGNCTFNSTGGTAGQHIAFRVTTSGTTSFTLTFGTNFKSNGTLATGTVTAKTFSISFDYDGTNWVEAGRTTAM